MFHDPIKTNNYAKFRAMHIHDCGECGKWILCWNSTRNWRPILKSKCDESSLKGRKRDSNMRWDDIYIYMYIETKVGCGDSIFHFFVSLYVSTMTWTCVILFYTYRLTTFEKLQCTCSDCFCTRNLVLSRVCIPRFWFISYIHLQSGFGVGTGNVTNKS